MHKLLVVLFFNLKVFGRDVNFREFHISRLVEYSKLTRHSVWTTHLMRECCNTVDITPCGCGWAAAPGKWRDGREAVTVSNYKAEGACLSHVLETRQTRPTDCCHPKLITRCGCNCPTMNSPSCALTLTGWAVYSFIGYRCSVDKAADSTCVLFVE